MIGRRRRLRGRFHDFLCTPTQCTMVEPCHLGFQTLDSIHQSKAVPAVAKLLSRGD
jgi:hypothetical protein